MIKKILETYKSFEKITYKIMGNGLKFCFIICLISVFTLSVYHFNFTDPFIYYIGISLFKLSLIFGIEFIICGFVAEGIKKQII